MPLATTTYNLRVNVGGKYTYTLSELNDPDYLDDSSDFTGVGDKAVMEITKIEDNTGYWLIEIKSTILKTEKEEKYTYRLYKEPNVFSMTSVVCPVPVSTYLTELADAWNIYYEQFTDSNEGDIVIEASGTTFTFIKDGNGFKTTFNANSGWATKMQYIENDEVKAVVTGAPGGGIIPGYELPLLLGITGLMAVGIIYTVMKKRTQ